MAKQEASRRLSEDERRAVFLALVAAQDMGMGVVRSRKESPSSSASATARCDGLSRRAWTPAGHH